VEIKVPANFDWFSALVEEQKLRGYIFNPASKSGWPKGRFLQAIGFVADDLASVQEALLAQALNGVGTVIATGFGPKIEADGMIDTPSGRQANIRTIWLLDPHSGKLRLVTFTQIMRL
jgi:hypothetical protein